MGDIKIVKLSQMNEVQKLEAVQIFINSFYELFTSISKDKSILKELFLPSFDFSLAYVAIENHKVLGFMAIETSEKKVFKFDKIRCIEIFGNSKGTIIYYQLSKILSKPKLKNSKDIGIDYLATDKDSRGRGIGTRLLKYAFEEICDDVCYIDVSSNNINAKRLYEHIGFKQYKKEYSIRTFIDGNGYICKMKKDIINNI